LKIRNTEAIRNVGCYETVDAIIRTLRSIPTSVALYAVDQFEATTIVHYFQKIWRCTSTDSHKTLDLRVISSNACGLK